MSVGTFAYIKLHNMTEQVSEWRFVIYYVQPVGCGDLNAPLPRQRHEILAKIFFYLRYVL